MNTIMAGIQNVGFMHWQVAIAILALLQPWIITLYEKYLKPQRIQIFEAGKVEIGYSNLGPTIGLNGTMKAENNSVFVQTVELELVRENDKSTHNFEASFFRSNKIRISPNIDMEIELASGFMVTTIQPHRFNILFVDNKAQRELEKTVEEFWQEWILYLQKRKGEDMSQAHMLPFDNNKYYEEYFKMSIHVNTYTKVERIRYWEPGKYKMTLKVKTDNPDREFKSTLNFSITESDAKLLSFNSLEILKTICGVGTNIWNFANCIYEK